jgi:TetR/AcrR family transcriptional regulator
MSKAKLSRREREKIRHKEEILEAALMLFSEKGFQNVSMQEIAEASEFGIGTLYNFFQSKETLFEEIMTRTEDYVVSEFTQILDSPGTEKERLSKFIRHHPEFMEKRSDVIKLFVSEYGIRGYKLSKNREDDEICEVLTNKLAQLVEQGIEKNLFRSVDPAITAKTLGSICETLVFDAAGRFDKDTVTEMFKKVEQLFLDGLLKR